MGAQKITDTLFAALEQHGFKSAIISARHVPKLRETIKENLASGKIDDGVYRQYSVYFDNKATKVAPWAESIIVIAAPRPMLEVHFNIDGKKRSAVIPPTYEHSIDEVVTETVEQELEPSGYQISRAALPQKLLATRSGLARYGKNNISYVEGLGSFFRLLAFYTDLPTVNDGWQKPQILDQCQGCKACIKKCPTGAIDPNQFQLRAERCLTYHNESSQAFPQWIDESWHHCLIGCMRCQDSCPVNKDVRYWTEPFAEFSEKESAQLLKGDSPDELSVNIISKFQNTDLLDDPAMLARNLKSLMVALD